MKYLEIASEFSDEPELRTRLETQMYVYSKNEGAHTWSDNYFAENVNQIRYKMILRNDGEQNAQEFIARNLRFTSFRKMTIDRAMQNSEYEQVIRLAKEGEAKDINLPGLLNNWKKYRYKAYKLAGKLDEQRELARYFILDGNFEYYLELKNTYAPDKWVEIYPCIISSMENRNARNTNIYTRILIEEGEKGKLLWYVKKIRLLLKVIMCTSFLSIRKRSMIFSRNISNRQPIEPVIAEIIRWSARSFATLLKPEGL